MEKKNKYFIGWFLIIAVLVLIGIVFLLHSGTGTNEEYIEENNESSIYISTEKDISSTVSVSAGKLSPNTKPNFKVGQVFKYIEKDNSNVDTEYTFFVKKIERINKNEHYVIEDTEIRKSTSTTEYGAVDETGNFNILNIKNNDLNLNTRILSTITINIYVDANTGNVSLIEVPAIDNSTDTIVMKDEAALAFVNGASGVGKLFYGTWMLSLNDNFKWRQEQNASYDQNQEQTYITEYKVLGKEKINDQECFKVEARETFTMKEGEVNTNSRNILWIDVNDRILVKLISYSENLKTREINLVS